MEIIARKKQGPFKFRVLRSFFWDSAARKVGEIIEVDAQTATGMTEGRMIDPILPEEATYIALTPLKLPGREEAFECKKLDTVILKSDQAIDLMIKGMVIPSDPGAWRPRDRRLKKPHQS